MKKRLRKKKHLKEFAEYGRYFKCRRSTKENANDFLNEFIEMIEKNKCLCGGSIGEEFLDIVIEFGKEPNINDKYNSIKNWINSRDDILFYGFSEPFDLWHDDDLPKEVSKEYLKIETDILFSGGLELNRKFYLEGMPQQA